MVDEGHQRKRRSDVSGESSFRDVDHDGGGNREAPSGDMGFVVLLSE